jgi:diguanylate cyclase (GGDEF)-like protein
MGGRVLVVDDEPEIRAVLRAALEDAGFDCIVAADGSEALELARATVPEAVILDVRMPVLGGDEVHRAMRGDGATRYVPVIFLSAQRDAKSKARLLLEGADDYVTKPFDTDELVARVTAAIRRTASLRALNPLSGLPGNLAITGELARQLAQGLPSACLYVDLDHFKEFNDHYGFARGDELIVLLARLLGTATQPASAPAFVGHVGGDDFVLVVPERDAEDIARLIVRSFDRQVPWIYDTADRERGFIVRTDRRGVEMKLPFVSVSIGIVPVSPARFADAVAVSRAAAEVKEIAKRRDGSSWAVDRRQASEGSATLPVA